MYTTNMNNLLQLGNISIALGVTAYVITILFNITAKHARFLINCFSISLLASGLAIIQLTLEGFGGIASLMVQFLLTIFIIWLLLMGKNTIYFLAIILLSLAVVLYLLDFANFYEPIFEISIIFLITGIIFFSLLEKPNEKT